MRLPAGLFARVVAWLCVAGLGAPAMAQDDNTLMTLLEFEELRGIVEELDFAVTDEGVDEDGDYYFEVESDTGLLFNLYGARCDEADPRKDCQDLNVVGTFSLAADADIHEVMETISYAFMKVYRSGDDVKIARYLVFDGGVGRENVKENIRIFAEIGEMIWSDLVDQEVLAE
jgi:hypothetical protein